MLLQMITDVIGDSPAGWEFIPYLVSVIIFLLIFGFVINLIFLPLKKWGFK